MRNPLLHTRLGRAEDQLENEVKLAADRIQGVEWTAAVKNIILSSAASSSFDLPPLPEPLSMAFYVDPEDPADWSEVKAGDRVRFGCKFVVNSFGEYPSVTVRMTLLEIMGQ